MYQPLIPWMSLVLYLNKRIGFPILILNICKPYVDSQNSSHEKREGDQNQKQRRVTIYWLSRSSSNTMHDVWLFVYEPSIPSYLSRIKI